MLNKLQIDNRDSPVRGFINWLLKQIQPSLFKYTPNKLRQELRAILKIHNFKMESTRIRASEQAELRVQFHAIRPAAKPPIAPKYGPIEVPIRGAGLPEFQA